MTQGSEADRVRGYIVSQANKLSIPDLVAKVRSDTAPLRDAASAVPASKFSTRPGDEDWSAAQVFTHILEMNEQGASAIECILDSGAIPPVATDVMRGGTRADLQTADDYWGAYESRRESLLGRALNARGDEHLDVQIVHQMFGPFSWREWLLFMRVHDLDHMRQLQAIAARFSAPES